MVDLVKNKQVEHEFEGVPGVFSFLEHQSKAGYTVRCLKNHGQDVDLLTEGKEYQVIAGKGDEFTDYYGNTVNIIWDEAGILDDFGNHLIINLNPENDSVKSGALSEFGILDDEAFEKSLKD